jgi:hypothetical protein
MSRYWVFPADPVRHRPDILAVLSRNLPDISPARVQWNLEGVPQPGARWWLAQEEGSADIVGVVGLFLRRLRVGGHSCLAAVAGDFAVDRAHRAFGPAWALQKAMLAAMSELGLDFIYTVPNRLSEALVQKLGYRPVGEMARHYKVLRAEHRQGVWLPPQALTRFAAGPVNASLALFSREFFYRRPSGLFTERPDGFDGRFDRFWAEMAGEAGPITSERTSAYLNWRYLRSPHRLNQCFALAGAEREIMGYVVYYLQANLCRIVDLAAKKKPGIAEALLAEFLLHLRRLRAGSVLVSCLGAQDWAGRLPAFGFFHRAGSPAGRLYVYPGSAELQAQGVFNPGAWSFFEGDNDL